MFAVKQVAKGFTLQSDKLYVVATMDEAKWLISYLEDRDTRYEYLFELHHADHKTTEYLKALGYEGQ